MSTQQASRALPLLFFPAFALTAFIWLPGACSRVADDQGCLNQPVLKGPFVVAVTETEATVRWDSAEPGCAELTLLGEDERRVEGTVERFDLVTDYRVDDSIAEALIGGMLPDLDIVFEPDEPGPVHMREVRVAGLQPATCYEYRIRTGGEDPTHRFCTAKPAGEKIKLVVVGDTMVGLGNAHPLLPGIAQSKPDFIIHTGDLQYYPGIIESWSLWSKVMQPLFSTAAVFPCVGNHEFEETNRDENGDFIDATEFDDYYARFFNAPGDKGSTRWYTFRNAGVHFFSLDTESPLNGDSPQGKWLIDALAEAKEDPGFRFSVLFFHRPAYTLNAKHSPRLDVREFLAPLYEPNGIKLVLVGHVHAYERFEIGDVLSITTGGGGAGLYSVSEYSGANAGDVPLRQMAVKAYHFLELEIDGDLIVGRAIDREGEVIDSFEWSVN